MACRSESPVARARAEGRSTRPAAARLPPCTRRVSGLALDLPTVCYSIVPRRACVVRPMARRSARCNGIPEHREHLVRDHPNRVPLRPPDRSRARERLTERDRRLLIGASSLSQSECQRSCTRWPVCRPGYPLPPASHST